MTDLQDRLNDAFFFPFFFPFLTSCCHIHLSDIRLLYQSKVCVLQGLVSAEEIWVMKRRKLVFFLFLFKGVSIGRGSVNSYLFPLIRHIPPLCSLSCLFTFLSFLSFIFYLLFFIFLLQLNLSQPVPILCYLFLAELPKVALIRLRHPSSFCCYGF